MGFIDNHGYPVKTPVSHITQELCPKGFCFSVTDINTQDFGNLLLVWSRKS